MSAKTQSTVRISGKSKCRTLIGTSIERREQVTFMALPLVDDFVRASWTKRDGDIVLSCPMCGTRNVLDIGGEYRIKSNGLLYPSVLCKNVDCTFDHYVLLRGYNAMGRFARARERQLGVVFYAMMWEKPVLVNGKMLWQVQPCEYTHATDVAEARRTWRGLLDKEQGRVIGIAPSIDPHVSGDADPSTSVLHL